MPSWRKVITSGSDASLSNLVVTGGITGSLQGTASYAVSALNASTASYYSGSVTTAETASYVLPLRQAVLITGSLNVSGSTTQIGNNILAGNTTLSGSIIISGSTTNPVTPTIKVFGDMETNGVIKFTPVDKSIDTTISASYIYVSGSTNDLYFSQNGSGFTNFTRLRWLEGNLYTGLLSGGVITSTPGSTTFSISSGSGIIVSLNAFTSSADPFPTIQYITWPTTTQPITNSGSAKITYVGISNVGTVVQQTVPWGSTNIDQWDQQIELGTVLHLSGSVSTGVYNSPQVGYGEAQRTDDFVRSFGPLKISGHVLQPSGSTLSLIKSAGFAYNNGANYINNPNHPSTVSDPAITVSKIYRYHISGSTPVIDTGVAAAGYTVIDPSKYVRTSDGTLQNIPGGQYSIQRVFWFPNSPTNAFIVYYGNDYYNSAANAQLALQTEVFTEAPNTAQNAIFLGSIIIAASETNLQNATIVPAGLFRQVGGIGSTGTTPVTTALSSLSDVAITSVTAGDLLTYGGGQWNNSKTLNGTYTINGGLTVTGSLIATASRATSASRADSAVTASYVLNAVSASFASTASFVANAFIQNGNSFGTTATLGTNDAQNLILETNNTTRLFVSSSGNVGIGTTTPTQRLQVSAASTTIAASNLTGSTVLIGTPTAGLGIDTNEIATSGSGLVLSTLDNTAIGFRTNKQQHVTISGSGEVGIGITVPTAKLHINNTTPSASFLVEDSTNPDTTPFVIDASGNVAIGTGSAFEKVTIQNGNIALKDSTNSAQTSIVFTPSDNTLRNYITTANSSSALDDYMKVGSWFGSVHLVTGNITGSTTRLYVSRSGEIGVGISSSLNARFHINNTTTQNSFLVEDSANPDSTPFVIDSAGDVSIGSTSSYAPYGTITKSKLDIYSGNSSVPLTIRRDDATGDHMVFVKNDTGAQWWVALTNDDFRLYNLTGSDNILFGVDGGTNDRGNKVGIGVGVPTARLHVNNTSTSASFLVEDSTNPDSTPFVIDAAGNVGIGTSSPTALLHISSSTPSILTIERSINANAHIQYKNSASAMWAGLAPTIPNGYFGIGSTIDLVSASFVVMSGSGNVGIGTTTPNAKLVVSGSAIITGSLTVTQGITGSLFGTASWAQNAATSSYVLNSVSSSFASTASFLNTLNQNLTFNGNLTLNGTASISYLNVLFESASVIYSSGSNQLGDATNDTQTLIGTTVLSGSLQLTGSANLPSITGSLLGTASYAVNADTASVANLALSVGTLNQVLIVSGSSNNGTSLVRITQTGAGNAFLVEDEANVDSTPFVIDTTGNVGIGTLTPTAKLDVVGNANISGSLSVTGVVNANLTGSVFGTASWAQNAVTASYIVTAQTASYVLNAVSSSFASTSQNANTASFVTTAQTASYVLNAVSASFATSASRSVSSSFATTAQTASYVLNAVSASFATTSQTASYVLNAVTASFVTLSQTASFVTTTQTASYVLNAVSSSFASTASFILNAVSSSFSTTASYVLNAVSSSFSTTASYVLNAVTASFASTASFVNTLNQNVIITGSIAVTQNITASAFATTNALITSTATTINSGITTIYNIPTASYDGAWFDYTIRSGSNARAGSIMGIWSGSAVNYAETTTTDFGNTSGFALGMSVVGANMILSSSATTSGWSFNAIVRSV